MEDLYWGSTILFSVFLSLKHNLCLGLMTAFYQVPLLNHIIFLSFALVTLSSFIDIAKKSNLFKMSWLGRYFKNHLTFGIAA